MTVWFTSDLHFRHRLVAKHRGFTVAGEPDPDAHDAAVMDRWRSVVRPGDHVWVLGDLAVSSPRFPLDLVTRLPGCAHLVWGNHDQGHPMYRDSHKRHALYLRAFDSVQQSARRRIEGQEVLLSHFPYEGDHTIEERHTQWRLRDEGVPILHGHTHSDVRESWTSRRIHIGPQSEARPTLQVHVGLDAWDLTPVSLEMVTDILRNTRV